MINKQCITSFDPKRAEGGGGKFIPHFRKKFSIKNDGQNFKIFLVFIIFIFKFDKGKIANSDSLGCIPLHIIDLV